jgi:hypothetical protein
MGIASVTHTSQEKYFFCPDTPALELLLANRKNDTGYF